MYRNKLVYKNHDFKYLNVTEHNKYKIDKKFFSFNIFNYYDN